MTLRLVGVGFGANDPVGLARFWGEALRWEVRGEAEGEVCLVPGEDGGFRIRFLPVPGRKVGKNRIHLDLTTTSVDDQTATVESLIGLGARHVDIGQRPDEAHVVLADPEGNELCVIEPDNAFLAGCGRLGSITCDGSRAVGLFWSEALGWPLVWDQDEETAIRSPDGTGPFITWGPPVPPKVGRNRLHLDIGPLDGPVQRSELDRLLSLGATPIDIPRDDVDQVVMADPDGNEFCVVSPTTAPET
jgi:catechol 2,3-dioxygenase-like lactoylglutathione lyase family enzyme